MSFPVARPVAARSGAECVLELARKRGRHGVHPTDFDAGRVVEGGKPIRRLPARIDKLKARGHWFTMRRNRDRTTTYVLVRDADVVALTLREASHPEPERLFDPLPVRWCRLLAHGGEPHVTRRSERSVRRLRTRSTIVILQRY
jgi:hypothetical protein